MSPLTVRQVAEVAARRAETVTGVVRLDSGPLHTKTTYGAGGKTDGVTVQGTSVTVHVVVRFGDRIPELADRIVTDVRAALRKAGGDAVPWDIGVEVMDVVTDDPPVAPRRELQ